MLVCGNALHNVLYAFIDFLKTFFSIQCMGKKKGLSSDGGFRGVTSLKVFSMVFKMKRQTREAFEREGEEAAECTQAQQMASAAGFYDLEMLTVTI